MAHTTQPRAQRRDWKLGANDKAEESLLIEKLREILEFDMIKTSNVPMIF
jgi:hypothetical protein